MIPFPDKKYNIIYADPPWNGLGWNNGSGDKCPANHYRLMGDSDILSMPVSGIAEKNSALFLWGTWPNLPLTLNVVGAWGFKYSTCAFTWAKRNKIADSFFVGCGNYTRANTEFCLLGIRGKMQKKVLSHSVRQLCTDRIGAHSKKPDELRNRIVQLFGDLPRIELFARQKTPGWDVWGNEV